MVKKLVIANWKMNPSTSKEADKLFTTVAKSINRIKKTEIVVCPPVIYLERLKKISKKMSLGAQDAFLGDVGAYTGEVSAEMLYNLGVKFVILGHSERRAMGESNGEINKKLKASLASGLVPILCIGETERDESHEYFNTVKTQIKECLNGVNKSLISKIVIAYEPVWSISTTPDRRDATANDSREMSVYIRKVLSDMFSQQMVKDMRIIYGGSVNERDAEEFIREGGVDGVLVGRASLSPDKFVKIINIAEKI